MNSRIRTIFFLVGITTIVALALMLELVSTAGAQNATSQFQSAAALSDANPIAASPQATNAISYTLTLNTAGSGSGNVRHNGNDYSPPVTYLSGTVVTLSAIPDLGSEFVIWSGNLTTDVTPDTIKMDGNKSVTADFKLSCYQLTLEHTGTGSNPTPSPANSIGCNPGYYNYQEEITLTGNPAAHWEVKTDSWSGTENNLSNKVIMPAASHTAGVTYVAICYSLSLTRIPVAGGTVSATAPNCPGVPTKYIEGSVVGLEAFDALGYAFTNWTVGATGSVNPTTVTMNSNLSVTANFALSCHALSKTHSPPGAGTNPVADPTKSASCNAGEYVAGEVIGLTAAPVAGWRVESWQNTDDDNRSLPDNVLTFPKLADGAGYVVGVNYIQKPTLQFKLASYQVVETVISATIEVERTGSLSESVDVWYRTSEDTAEESKDYVDTSNRLTFGENVVSQSFSVQILDDNISEGTESLDLELFDVSSNAVLGTQSTAQLVILDDEGELTVQFQTTSYTAQEISPTVPVFITLFPIATENIYVDFRTEEGTAASGQDYTDVAPKTIRFKPGETVKQVEITLKNDALDEPDETVQLRLSNADGAILGESQATLTIIDDDAPPSLQFENDEYFAKEGDVSAPVSITLSAASAFSVTVQYDVIELSVGLQFAGSVTFDPGETNKVITIPTSAYEVDDKLNIILSEAEHGTIASPSSTTVTILDKDRSECHVLSMTNTGHGQLPKTTNLQKSVGCPQGQFVADELIFVLAEPDSGWLIDGWFGTLDDELTNTENIVRMPNSDHVISVYYITSLHLPVISNIYTNYFAGTVEAEPNDGLSQSNGPIHSGQDYFGGFSSSSDSFDNYFFVSSSKGSVKIQLVDIPTGRDYNLLLLDSHKNLLGYSGSLSNDDEHISVGNLDSGLYYVSIYYNSGPTSTAKYRLNVVYD